MADWRVLRNWFKVVEMLQQNWALVDTKHSSSSCMVYFIQDASGVFDKMQFDSMDDAARALRRNDFKRYAEDDEAHKFIKPPQTPFYEAQHPNGKIYSSGRFWR